jgi:hypothetical protein
VLYCHIQKCSAVLTYVEIQYFVDVHGDANCIDVLGGTVLF